MGDGAICNSCFKRIENEEPWHYRYNSRAGLLEPVHDKCSKPDKDEKGGV